MSAGGGEVLTLTLSTGRRERKARGRHDLGPERTEVRIRKIQATLSFHGADLADFDGFQNGQASDDMIYV
jgi:hypothetical protein